MALNVNRWLNYAKARIDSAVGSGNESLDRLEAKQEADRADKPWLASDSTAPTFDEARARIAWEADQQAKKAARHQDPEDPDRADMNEDDGPADTPKPAGRNPSKSGASDQAPTPSVDGPTDAGPAPRSPQQIAEDAERETARLELEERQQQSVERLAEIRRELGIEDPPNP